MYAVLRKSGGDARTSGRGASILNRNQRAAARQLSLTAYLLYSRGHARDERSIRDNLPPYADVYKSSLGAEGEEERAGDALRKQLHRDVEALSRAGIRVEVEGEAEGRRYRLPAESFSPAEFDLSQGERAVLVGALRALRRDFPYSAPLRLAIANLIGSVAEEGQEEEAGAFAAAVSTGQDEALSRSVAQLESAVSRRKRVRFAYYSISRDATSDREVEPYALSLLDGTWYVTGWDVQREAVRQFRLSRIRSRITFVTKKESGDFEVPENFERRLAGPRAPWQLAEPRDRARIRVSDRAMAEAHGKYLWAVSMDGSDREGTRLLSTPFSGERQLAGWALSLGEEAEVLSPKPLVGRVVEGLERLAAAHANSPGERA